MISQSMTGVKRYRAASMPDGIQVERRVPAALVGYCPRRDAWAHLSAYSDSRLTPTKGSAVVASMLVAVIILGAMLMLHTAAVVTIGGTSRALEIARQNSAAAVRLERATREAAQSVYGVSPAPSDRGFEDELRTIIGTAPLGALEVSSIQVSSRPSVPRMFPDLAGAPSELNNRSPDFDLLCTPELMAYAGSRTAESDTFEVRYTFVRQAVKSAQTYSLGVKCRLVTVPISRFGIMPYDLPDEIGKPALPGGPAAATEGTLTGPRGLVPSRDSADIPDLSTGSKRPAHFRYAAVLSETYEYIFSKTYLQNAADYAGVTHFVQIGAGTANPSLVGGTEVGQTYTLDVGAFGQGALGPKVATRDLALIYATAAGCSLVLTDSGGNTTPMVLVIAGPADRAAGPISVQLPSAMQRPIVLICYHAQLDAAPDSRVNGALLLDRDCIVPPAIGPLSVGHVSYWGGSIIQPGTFKIWSMPAAAENLVPRAVYVAAAKTFL